MPKPALKIGAILALILAFALYVWLSTRLPPPREQERVSHLAKIYSIIKPRGWEEVVRHTPTTRYKDTIELLEPGGPGLGRRFFLGRFHERPDIEEIQARDRLLGREFQGKPAWVFDGRTRREYYWRAVFQRGGEWYELVLWLPLEEDVPRSAWWPYLQSFRASESPTSLPAMPPPESPVEIQDGGLPGGAL